MPAITFLASNGSPGGTNFGTDEWAATTALAAARSPAARAEGDNATALRANATALAPVSMRLDISLFSSFPLGIGPCLRRRLRCRRRTVQVPIG